MERDSEEMVTEKADKKEKVEMFTAHLTSMLAVILLNRHISVGIRQPVTKSLFFQVHRIYACS